MNIITGNNPNYMWYKYQGDIPTRYIWYVIPGYNISDYDNHCMHIVVRYLDIQENNYFNTSTTEMKEFYLKYKKEINYIDKTPIFRSIRRYLFPILEAL